MATYTNCATSNKSKADGSSKSIEPTGKNALQSKRKFDEQYAVIVKLKDETKQLKEALVSAELLLSQQGKLMIILEEEILNFQKQNRTIRASEAVEIDEMKKVTSMLQSFLQNKAEALNSNKPETDNAGRNIEQHKKEMNDLQRKYYWLLEYNASLHIRQAEFEYNFYVMSQNKDRQAKEIAEKNISLAKNIRELKTLAEQVDDLTAQLEAERSARAELASEKDHILSDLKLLHKRHQQLIDETQNRRIAKNKATVATNESLNKLESPAEQSYMKPILRCPLCNRSYDDISSLQNHVEDCFGEE